MQTWPIATAKDFGAALRAKRKSEGLTQRELALATGAGERFIVELESGKETARLGKALEVAAALGMAIILADAD
ncbi:anaerobic benzoate catabolism transcriptional regulator [compost metagenome]